MDICQQQILISDNNVLHTTGAASSSKIHLNLTRAVHPADHLHSIFTLMLLLTIRIIWKYIFSSVVAGFLDRQFVICGTPLMSTHPQSVLCIFVPFPLTGISINQEKNAKNKSIFADSTLSVNHLIMIILWTTTRQQEWSRQPGSVLLLYPLFRYSWAGMQHPSTCR